MLFREAYAQHVTSGGNASALKNSKGKTKAKATGNTAKPTNSSKGLSALKGKGKTK